MNPGRLLTLFRAALLTALFACMVLVLDYQNPVQPTFCGATSGCAEVQSSDLGIAIAMFLHTNFGGVGLPQLGLFALLALLVVSFTLRPASSAGSVGPDGRTYASPTFIRGRVSGLAIAAGLGGLVAAGLVIAQATIHAFCLYCMIVDTSMMFAAACAIVLWRTTGDEAQTKRALQPASSALVIGLWSMLATAAIGLPFLWTLYPIVPPLPKALEELQVPGKITMVSMTDFECPFCRRMHPFLTAARKNPDVVFKRIMAPLGFHPHAAIMARAYVCVPEDRRDEMADRLYEIEPDAMDAEAFIAMATEFGVTREDFLACVDSDAAIEQVSRDAEIFTSLGGRGLPLTYVGKYAVFGLDPERLDVVLKRAKVSRPELPVWALYALCAALLAGVTAYSWRRCREPAARPRRSLEERTP
ncbi:MAG: DsbA family protein [Polyangiaceae bacterium]